MEATPDGLRVGPIMVRQLVGTQLQGGEHLWVRTVGNAFHQCARERHLDERERVPALSQVRRTEGRTAEGSEHLANGVLRRFGEITNRRAIMKIEPSDALAGNQVRG